MPGTGAVSSGSCLFWNIEKRLTDAGRTLARGRWQAGPEAAVPVARVFFTQRRFLFLGVDIIDNRQRELTVQSLYSSMTAKPYQKI